LKTTVFGTHPLQVRIQTISLYALLTFKFTIFPILIFKLVRLGLYEIDSGLNPLDEDDPRMGHLMAYADLNSDMYTDIIALAEDKSMLNLFYFNPVHLRFYLGNELKTSDCSKIINVAVGRSQSHLRIFVTCNSNSGSTIVRFYDRTDKGYNELP